VGTPADRQFRIVPTLFPNIAAAFSGEISLLSIQSFSVFMRGVSRFVKKVQDLLLTGSHDSLIYMKREPTYDD
jgi:hypothetical protein